MTPNFFRIHLSTVLLVMFVASLLLYANVVFGGAITDPEMDIASQFDDSFRDYGWPLAACYTYKNKDRVALGEINKWTVGWDVFFNGVILVLVVVPMEWAERRRPWLR